MAKFKKLALLCTAILASGTMAVASGCDLFAPASSASDSVGTESSIDSSSLESDSEESSAPEAVTYSVKFVNEDGTVLQESEVAEGQRPVYSGETPTKMGDAQYGYEFDGWTETIVEATADVTYVAKFKQILNKYTVTFDTDGGSTVEAQTVPYGTLASELVNFTSTKEGYTFKDWTMADGSAIPENATVTENITVKADWEIITYSAKVVRIDGTEQTVSFTVENRASVLANIALTDNDAQYTYAWITALPNELALNNDQVFTETRTVNNYTITFETDGGSAVETKTVPYGTPASALEQVTTTQAGYKFVKWQILDGENFSDIPAGAIVESNMTLKAVWIKECSVKYFGFNGAEVNSATAFEGDKLTAVDAPELYNATFDGWYDETLTTEWNFEQDTVNADTKLYAKYIRTDATATEFESFDSELSILNVKTNSGTVEYCDEDIAGVKGSAKLTLTGGYPEVHVAPRQEVANYDLIVFKVYIPAPATYPNNNDKNLNTRWIQDQAAGDASNTIVHFDRWIDIAFDTASIMSQDVGNDFVRLFWMINDGNGGTFYYHRFVWSEDMIVYLADVRYAKSNAPADNQILDYAQDGVSANTQYVEDGGDWLRAVVTTKEVNGNTKPKLELLVGENMLGAYPKFYVKTVHDKAYYANLGYGKVVIPVYIPATESCPAGTQMKFSTCRASGGWQDAYLTLGGEWQMLTYSLDDFFDRYNNGRTMLFQIDKSGNKFSGVSVYFGEMTLQKEYNNRDMSLKENGVVWYANTDNSPQGFKAYTSLVYFDGVYAIKCEMGNNWPNNNKLYLPIEDNGAVVDVEARKAEWRNAGYTKVQIRCYIPSANLSQASKDRGSKTILFNADPDMTAYDQRFVPLDQWYTYEMDFDAFWSRYNKDYKLMALFGAYNTDISGANPAEYYDENFIIYFDSIRLA